MSCYSCRAQAAKKCGKDVPYGVAWYEPDWQEPDAEPAPEAGPDRDSRVLRYAANRAAGREKMTPQVPGGHPDRAWGGALRRMADATLSPGREDEHRYVSIPGRYCPIGFARYVDPLVDPYSYEYYRLAGWRVAVPRSLPGDRVRDLLYRCFYYGPASAGYRRIGDVLVPAILDSGDRMTLAESAVEWETYPMSP